MTAADPARAAKPTVAANHGAAPIYDGRTPASHILGQFLGLLGTVAALPGWSDQLPDMGNLAPPAERIRTATRRIVAEYAELHRAAMMQDAPLTREPFTLAPWVAELLDALASYLLRLRESSSDEPAAMEAGLRLVGKGLAVMDDDGTVNHAARPG